VVEYFDIYDEALNKIGVKARDDVHRDGDWHCVFHCWVIYRDESGTDYVIAQKRSANKKIFPEFLDISAAGHYATGETMHDGIREIEEELGLVVNFEDLIPVGRRVGINTYNGLIDREIADVFFYICDQPLAHYVYQKEELAGLIALDVDAGLRLFDHTISEMSAPTVGLGQSTVSISLNDFVPTIDRYFHKILVLTKRCLDGEDHLLI